MEGSFQRKGFNNRLLKTARSNMLARKDMLICDEIILTFSFKYKTRGWLQASAIFGEQLKFYR
jgi:hypothetical protein